VELRFDVMGSALPEDVKRRLIALAGRRMTADGVLLIDSRVHRTQAQNRDAARARLYAMIEQAGREPKPRRRTRPGRLSREKRIASKKRHGAVKALRRRSPGEDE
jgi:ribosome-associated protein